MNKNKYLSTLLFVSFALLATVGATQWFRELNVGSGSNHASSIFDVVSTAKGSRPAPSMTEAQRDAISSPATGLMIFNTDTNTLNQYNGSVWGAVAGGGVGGGYNLEDEPWAQGGTNSYAVYDDGASATPVDLTGGSPTSTFAANATTTQIAAGDYKGAYVWSLPASDVQGEGVSKAFALNEKDLARGYVIFKLSYSADVSFSTGDFLVGSYCSSGTSYISGLTDNEIIGLGADAVGELTVKVNFPNTCTTLTLGVHRAVTDATATEFYFSFVSVGSDEPLIAPIKTYLGELTTTGSWVTNTTYTGRYWRDDDKLIAKVKLALTGAPTNAALTLTIPSSLTIDIDKTFNSNINRTLGEVSFYDNGTNTASGRVNYSSTTAVEVRSYSVSGSLVSFATLSSTAPWTWANTDEIYVEYEVYIEEWANQNTIFSTTEMLNRGSYVDGRGNSGAALTANVTDITFTEVDDRLGEWDGSGFTARSSGFFIVNGEIYFTAGVSVGILAYIDGSTGVRVGSMSASTDLYPFTWAGWLNTGQRLSFRSNGAATLSNSTTNHHISITSVFDPTVFGVFGQYGVESAQSSDFRLDTSGYATAEWAQMTGNSVTLQPGTWKLDGKLQLIDGGTNHAADVLSLIWATTNGNNTTTQPTQTGATFLFSDDIAIIQGPGGGNQITSYFELTALAEIVTVTATTTIYLVPRATFSITGDGAFRTYITAMRVR